MSLTMDYFFVKVVGCNINSKYCPEVIMPICTVRCVSMEQVDAPQVK